MYGTNTHPGDWRFTRRAAKLLPERTILENAHAAAVLRSAETIPFFALTSVLTFLCGSLFGYIFGLLFPFFGILSALCYQIFLGNIFTYGQFIAGLNLYQERRIPINLLFTGVKDYSRVMTGMLWYQFRLFLWGFVPIMNIVKSYSYCLTPYILYAEPQLGPEEAMQRSAFLTYGRKMELFILDLKLTGWKLLNVVTFGLGGIVYYYAYGQALWAGIYLEAVRSTMTTSVHTNPDSRKDPPGESGTGTGSRPGFSTPDGL